MPTPRNDSYTAAAGLDIFGGRVNPAILPAWRSAMAPNTWAVIPGGTLADVDPRNNAAMNPNFPGGAPWAGTGGQPIICAGWMGMVFDKATDTLYMPLGGGHTDYAGNEPYKRGFGASSPWVLLRAPSGAIGNTITLNDGQEATGLYSDGRLRSVHSYANHVFVPGHGPVITTMSAHFSNAQGRLKKMFLVSPTTGEASLFADYTGISTADIGNGEGAACFDPTRGAEGTIFFIGSATTKMLKTDVATRVTTTVGVWDNNLTGGGSGGMLRYLQGMDLVAAMWTLDKRLRIFDPVTNLWTVPTFSGSWAAGFNMADSCPGIDWDIANQRFLLWNNTTDTTVVSTLTPPASGNPRTGVWVKDVLPVSVSNSVTPSNCFGSGAFGRVAYSPNLKALIVQNRTTEGTYVFATE